MNSPAGARDFSKSTFLFWKSFIQQVLITFFVILANRLLDLLSVKLIYIFPFLVLSSSTHRWRPSSAMYEVARHSVLCAQWVHSSFHLLFLSCSPPRPTLYTKTLFSLPLTSLLHGLYSIMFRLLLIPSNVPSAFFSFLFFKNLCRNHWNLTHLYASKYLSLPYKWDNIF